MMPITIALRMLKQEDVHRRLDLGYIVRPYVNRKERKKPNNLDFRLPSFLF